MAYIQCFKKKPIFDNFNWTFGIILLEAGCFDGAVKSNPWLGLIMRQNFKKKYGNQPVKRLTFDLKIHNMMKRAEVI